MICKECQTSGNKSKVVVKVKRFCDSGGMVFWDEEGKKHVHPFLKTFSTYTCTNNHSWTEWSYSNCSCGWTSENP